MCVPACAYSGSRAVLPSDPPVGNRSFALFIESPIGSPCLAFLGPALGCVFVFGGGYNKLPKLDSLKQ